MIVWGERIGSPRPRAALLAIADRLGLADHDGAGLLEIPAGANGRGLREAGVIPDAGPGYASCPTRPVAARTRDRPGGRRRRDRPRCTCSRPIRSATSPTAALWERALHRAGTGRRARLGPHRGAARARERDLPGRLLRREGGHGRAPRRPPPAAADRDRATRARCARAGAVVGRARRAAPAATSACYLSRWRSRSSWTRSRSTRA